MISAIFTDVDGTLLDATRQLSPRTIHAVRALAGTLKVVLASSRMPAAMRHLQAELGIEDHPLICYNGGYVLASGLHDEVYADHVIPYDVCRDIVNNRRKGLVHISLYHAEEWYAPQRDKWTDKEERVTKVSPQLRPFDDVLGEWKEEQTGAHKIMCMGEADDIASLYRWLSSAYSDRIHVYRSRPTYLELASIKVSKASGMELIMRAKGGQGGAMAFGDNYNDIEMLRMAEVGIAVDNAIQEAKDAADETTAAGKEDGVARALEKYFKLEWHP